MTHPGSDTPPPAEQSGAFAYGATDTAPPAQQGAPLPAEKKGVSKWLPIAGSVAVAGVVGVGSLTGWFGAGEAGVGDCVQLTGDTDFEIVDCDGDTAEYRIVGVEEEKQTYPTFMADDTSCAEFATTEIVLWEGSDLMTEEGNVYCAEAV
jgi:hypothetical protein